MRPLLIGTLAVTLTGCACLAPQQARQASLMGCSSAGANGFVCSDSAAGTPRMNSNIVARNEKAIAGKKEKPRHRVANTHTKNATDILPKMDGPTSVQPDDKSNIVVNVESTVAAKPQFSEPDNQDLVIKKAKVSIAAKMEMPASVEFGEMKRADRKDAVGKSIDSICGYVRGKTASGAETGDRPFLYLVQEDEAYIGGYTMATSPYHNICN